MFRHMMRNAASSEDEKSGSDFEEKMNKRFEMREKRQKFRRAVQEVGVHPGCSECSPIRCTARKPKVEIRRHRK